MRLYRDIAEAYLLIYTIAAPLACILGWVLLGKILSRRLPFYAGWYVPALIAGSLTAGAILLEAFVHYYDPRNYTLAAGVYLMTLAGLPFHFVSFVRLWQTISRLPPISGDLPRHTSIDQDDSVWPPQPRQQP